jgi:hypothetical protein
VTDLAHLYPDGADARMLTWAMVTAFGTLVTRPHALRSFHLARIAGRC